MDPGARLPFEILQSLLSNAYWDRCWIWQEICVSKESLILWGKNSFRWEELAETVRILSYSAKLVSEWAWNAKEQPYQIKQELIQMAHTLASARTLSLKEMCTAWWSRTPHLRELLHYSRNLDCTDARDRIYGILGLVREKDQLKPNYQTTTMAKVCVRATMKCIRSEHSLDILCDANEAARHHEWNLPSWTPDFSVSTNRTKPLLPGMTAASGMVPDADATKGLKPSLDFEKSNGRMLRLEIIKFLEPLSEYNIGIVGSDSSTDTATNWRLVSIDHGAVGPNARHPVFHEECLFTTAFSRTICFGMNITDISSRLKEVADWADDLGQKDERAIEAGERVREALLTGNWRFINADGFMPGMAPAASKEGDQLCFIPGARVPFLIREQAGVEGSYVLVGACYIHGYMHGRIAEDLGKGSVHREWIDLY